MGVKENIAKTIKLLRKERNLTQLQLSKETGIKYRSLINYENAVREPNSKNMAILENFFNVSGLYLRGETQIREKTILTNQIEAGFTRVDLPTEFLNIYLCKFTNDLINKEEELKKMKIYNTYSNSQYQYNTDFLESEILNLEIVVNKIEQALKQWFALP